MNWTPEVVWNCELPLWVGSCREDRHPQRQLSYGRRRVSQASDAEAAGDVDLTADLDPAARMDLFRLTALERGLGNILGRRVDLLPEPVEKPRLRASIHRDRRRAF